MFIYFVGYLGTKLHSNIPKINQYKSSVHLFNKNPAVPIISVIYYDNNYTSLINDQNRTNGIFLKERIHSANYFVYDFFQRAQDPQKR